MKKIILLFICGIVVAVSLNAQTVRFWAKLSTVGEWEETRIDLNSLPNATDEYDAGRDALHTLNTAFNFSTITADDVQVAVNVKHPLVDGKKRPYVDFPIYFKSSTAGTHTIEISRFNNNGYAFVRLVDTTQPEKFIVLTDGAYTFNQATATSTEYKNFAIRVYMASLLKKDADKDWNKPSNWYGGQVPGATATDAKYNDYVVIPENKNVEIPTGTFTIGSLLNSGDLSIKTGATLTIETGVKLASVKEFYEY